MPTFLTLKNIVWESFGRARAPYTVPPVGCASELGPLFSNETLALLGRNLLLTYLLTYVLDRERMLSCSSSVKLTIETTINSIISFTHDPFGEVDSFDASPRW